MFHVIHRMSSTHSPIAARWRRLIARALGLIMLMAWPAILWAQNAQNAPTASEPGAGTPTAIPTARPMTMEVIIVMLMVGAALFVVCKSSRRN